MKWLKQILAPRSRWRLVTYWNLGKQRDFWVYLLLGWHAPFDILICPRIRSMENANLRDYDIRLAFLDSPWMDKDAEPTIPMDLVLTEKDFQQYLLENPQEIVTTIP